MSDPATAHRPRLALWSRTGLGLRIFVGLLVVVVIEGCVLGVVAWAVGPSQLNKHLRQAGGASAEVATHAQRAYLSSISIALVAGLIVALIGGAVAAWFISSQLAKPLAKFSQVAQAVSAGDYSVSVEPSELGPEFDHVEKAFNDMTRRLQASEEARAQLIADVSHEMRTPLMTLTAYLEALEDGVRPPLATTWEVMADQVRRLTRLTNDMALASADQEASLVVDPQPMDLTKLVTKVVESWRADPLGFRLTIVGRVPPRPVVALCDGARIEQVLTNLIDNSCRHARGASRIEVMLTTEAGRARITVEDDGAGVAPADQARIFDRFYRADRSRTGTGAGLGLAISRAIMQAHGGWLYFEEPDGGGSRFVASLPLTPPRP